MRHTWTYTRGSQKPQCERGPEDGEWAWKRQSAVIRLRQLPRVNRHFVEIPYFPTVMCKFPATLLT